MQMSKADKSDAHGLAQIIKAGWYRHVGVKSLDSHTIRFMFCARAQLIAKRVEVGNRFRGMLTTFGIVLRWHECAVSAKRIQSEQYPITR